MTDMTMKERIARAALEAYYPQSLFNADHPEREKFRRIAEAVLDALRDAEPSHEMMSAMWSLSFTNSAASFKECWRALIDHIRNETPS